MELRVGILREKQFAGHDLVTNAMALAVEEVAARGVLPGEIELVDKVVEGLPAGSLHQAVTGWEELRAEGVLGIVGPVNSDNGMGMRDLISNGRVPTIVLGANSRIPGPWSFNVNWGSCPDDGMLVVNWAARRKARRLALVRDTAWHGAEWVEHAEFSAAREGVRIVARGCVPVHAATERSRVDAAIEVLEEARSVGVDAVVALCSTSGSAYAAARAEMGWDVPAVMTGGFNRSRWPQYAPLFEGWVGCSLVDEDNPVQQRFLDAYGQRFGECTMEDLALVYYDAVRVLLEGIALAPILTRDGVRAGLERLRFFPAAAGGPGTYLSFGRHDRRGYKGLNASVLRRCTGQNRSQWQLEGRYEPVAV